MNQQFRNPNLLMTTQAAEGLMRRRWSVAEIEELTRLGIFLEDERFELIGGEIVPMHAKGIRHELLKAALNRFWSKRAPDDILLVPETTFRLSEDSYVEPDFVFYRRSEGLARLAPKTALLAVEVSDTSFSYDLGFKAQVYASFGIREVWVINANTMTTYQHRQPRDNAYQSVLQKEDDEWLEFDFAPELNVMLSRLELV